MTNQSLTRSVKKELAEIERRVQKELFATTNAAHALVEHSRRIKNKRQIPNYELRARIQRLGPGYRGRTRRSGSALARTANAVRIVYDGARIRYP